MKYVRFGPSGMQVSRFCLGAMTFCNRLGDAEAQRVVDEAIDAGVNFIDTADSYGDSEEVLGRLLPPAKRERIFLATKVFRQFCRDRRAGRNSRVNIIHSLERSLKLLKTDYVDLYQLHHPDPVTPLDETLETLDTLVRQGKIRYVGVSNHYAWQMAVMVERAGSRGFSPIISLQANYNLVDRQIERETVPFLEKFGLGLMAYGPLCGGILTGKYKGGIPEGSRADKNRATREYLENPDVQAGVDCLEEVAKETGLAMNQAATLWILSKPYATTIILGGAHPDHFTPLYEVAEESLDEPLLEKLDEASAARVYTRFSNQPFRTGPGLDFGS